MLYRTLPACYGVNRVNPVFEVDDMLPDGSNEYNPSGLTLGCIPMPCLPLITGRRIIEYGTGSGPLPVPLWTVSAAGTAVSVELVPAKYTHSPELPQF